MGSEEIRGPGEDVSDCAYISSCIRYCGLENDAGRGKGEGTASLFVSYLVSSAPVAAGLALSRVFRDISSSKCRWHYQAEAG